MVSTSERAFYNLVLLLVVAYKESDQTSKHLARPDTLTLACLRVCFRLYARAHHALHSL